MEVPNNQRLCSFTPHEMSAVRRPRTAAEFRAIALQQTFNSSTLPTPDDQFTPIATNNDVKTVSRPRATGNTQVRVECLARVNTGSRVNDYYSVRFRSQKETRIGRKGYRFCP